MCRCTSSTATARYIDAAGLSFRDFLNGELPVLPGEKPTLDDWNDHLSTAFPEVRLKTFLEMRGADGGPWSRICALPALWVGLLYDDAALDAAWDLVKHWTIDERQALRDAVPKLALDAPIPGGGKLARHRGRSARHRRCRAWPRARASTRRASNETGFLDPLREIVRSGKVPAQVLLDRYHGAWGGDVSRVYTTRCGSSRSRHPFAGAETSGRFALARSSARDSRGTRPLRAIQAEYSR